MRVNILSGDQRVAVFVGALVSICAGILAWLTYEPYVHAAVEMPLNGEPKAVETCNYAHDRSELTSVTTTSGSNVRITLCFKAFEVDGRMLVPYRDSYGAVWYGEPQSDGVASFVHARAEKFALPSALAAELDQSWKKKRRAQILATGVATAVGAVGVWVVTALFGCMVRGSLVVPRRQDFKPPADQS